VSYGYGARRFSAEYHNDTQRRLPAPLLACWAVVTPGLCGILTVASLVVLAAGGETFEGARAPSGAKVVGLIFMLGPLAVMALGARDWRRKPSEVELAAKPGGYV